ncbi:hypothetical protein ARTSIC4J27_3213 [Pseudarthrobacter siccitolerans]|uniref:Uncharacterized protein n=1 Tax=Pseudarthrobacter siccitolerans TaxID=861266 RepID=A0A024H5E3_9MICC|nr:hypothetical protein ARTSIC4J27_3213 [Pseudarthrobacter siccitolerans]
MPEGCIPCQFKPLFVCPASRGDVPIRANAELNNAGPCPASAKCRW